MPKLYYAKLKKKHNNYQVYRIVVHRTQMAKNHQINIIMIIAMWKNKL